jgi:hypothetical protein
MVMTTMMVMMVTVMAVQRPANCNRLGEEKTNGEQYAALTMLCPVKPCF